MSLPARTLPFVPLEFLAVLLVSCLPGCGEAHDKLPREAVSGTVTLDGQPLPRGVLQMNPANQKDGTACGALIEDGKFTIPREQGPVPGEYLVVINSSQGEGGGGGAPAGAPGPVTTAERPKELIPPQYNTDSKLTVQIKAGAPNTLEFALKSK
jgi:hypothetical protein